MIVLANGCFDPLHYGHILHLRAARALGEFLVVALTSDDAVRREKGDRRPFYPWGERAEILRELRCVNRVIPCENAAETITRYRPGIFVKGTDYVEGGLAPEVRAACERVGAQIIYTDTPKLSASEFIGRMRAYAD